MVCIFFVWSDFWHVSRQGKLFDDLADSIYYSFHKICGRKTKQLPKRSCDSFSLSLSTNSFREEVERGIFNYYLHLISLIQKNASWGGGGVKRKLYSDGLSCFQMFINTLFWNMMLLNDVFKFLDTFTSCVRHHGMPIRGIWHKFFFQKRMWPF